MKSTILHRFIVVAAVCLLAIGLISRAAPFADIDGRLLKQWPTEDGYLMLTIARNMALGHGMSTADGTLPTNGTQPLATGIWALAFAAVDGDKVAGVTIVLWIELLASLVTASLLYFLVRRLFAILEIHRSWAIFCVGLWYASPIGAGNTMNCLESGIYVLLVTATVLTLLARTSISARGSLQMTWPVAAQIAILLSLCFYARNDSVFLIGAFCATSMLALAPRLHIDLRQLPKVLAIGAFTVMAAFPWLLNNVNSFGHLMPISGVAQSAGTRFGQNFLQAPIILFEYLTVLLPVPSRIESSPLVLVAVCGALGALLIAGVRRFGSAPLTMRPALIFVMVYAFAITLYYGFLHGAPWFMSRYLFPLSPFLAIVGVLILSGLLQARWLPRSVGTGLHVLVIVASVALAAGLNLRVYQGGSRHMHEQVVHWVLSNVREETWIGAIQTGTLGFFHDRTVNLDGKVNPEALEALLVDEIPAYADSKGLEVIADWYGLHAWLGRSPITENYRLVISDQQGNLSVLARRNWAPTRDPPRVVAIPF